MCGRFTLHIPPELLAEIFGLASIHAYPPSYNVAPAQQVPVIRTFADNGRRELAFLHWGLVPSWAREPSMGSRMINARAETIWEKPAFRHAIRYRRCIVPASGFFEWQEEGGKKQPLYLRIRESPIMGLAGIWEKWNTPEEALLETFAILTTTSNQLIEPIHDRMPVILHPREYDLWLDREVTAPEMLKRLYHPYPSELLDICRVSDLVNSPRNNSPACIEPLPAKVP